VLNNLDMSDLKKMPVKPQTGVEKALIAIWSQALGIKNIDVDDNFFDLGGNTPLALHLVEKIRTYLGIEISSNLIIENPTIKDLAQCLHRASQRTVKNTSLVQTENSDYRASLAQVRLWLQYNLEPSSPAYNLFSTYGLRGRLDRSALERALLALMQRHESLHTIFHSGQKGELLQRVVKPHLAITYENVEHCPRQEQELRLRQLVEADARKPFVLETGPLFRCLLIALSPDFHVLVLSAHHIITDGLSQQVMIADLAQLYHAISKDMPQPLCELKMQYRDFAEWQREWLSGTEWERQSNYWKAQLTGAPPVLSLPTDHPRVVEADLRPASIHHFILGEELSNQLHSLCLSSRATLFMTLLAGFQALIARYCWQDDLCIASPIANRPLKETEELIGFFVNTLILRANIEDNLGFSKFLSRTREVVLEALDHLAIPFDEIVSMLRPQRSPGMTPYAQVMFALQNIPTRLPESGELTFEPVTLTTGIPKFDLSLVLEKTNDVKREISGYFSFRSELFEETTIARMANCYVTLLSAAVIDASCSVFQLRILSDQERKQILEESNRPIVFAAQTSQGPGFDGTADASIAAIAVAAAQVDGPISHSQAYILDRYLQLVPPGAAGELCIAREKIVFSNGSNRDEQMGRFIENPFGAGTLYRTDQLAHSLSDGRIEVVGKISERARLGKKEIDLIQIHSVLKQHSDVCQSAATANQSAITFYIVPKKEALSRLDRLRAELRNTLAQHSASSTLIFVPALLFASNGQPDFDKMAESNTLGECSTPLTPVQKALVDIWRGALGVKNVGIHDNFFELGGNSLLVIRVATEARQQGLHFASRTLFRHQTIAELAETVKMPQSQFDRVLAKDRDWWPLSPIQRWFFHRNFFNSALWNMSTLFRAKGAIDVHRLGLAAEHLVQRHVALRLQFRKHEGEWVQYVVDKSDDIFHSFDLSHLDAAAQREELVRIGSQLQSSFRFNEGTLIRFGLFNLGSEGTRLLIAAHHLVCDGFSMNVVMEDLASIYARLSSSLRPENSRTGSSFLEWALLVHSPSTLARVSEEHSYWAPKREVGLPLDFPNGTSLVTSVQRLHTELSPSETAALLLLARQKYGTSIEVLLLWAVASCIMDWKNERFAVLTMLGHGRENEWAHLDLSRTVGYFTVHYPLVVEMPPDAGANTVDVVRRQLDAVPNQGIGYGILRFIYNQKYPDRSIPLQEEGDISFNYLGNYDLNLTEQGMFAISQEKAGSGREPKAETPYKFGYFGYILNGKLHAEWWYSLTLHKVQTIEVLADAFQQKLRSLLTI